MISRKLPTGFPSFFLGVMPRFFGIKNGDFYWNNSKESEEFVYKYNYNFEQYPQYKKKVQEAKEVKEKRLNPEFRIPRRKRRVYDRPKHDTNLENYTAWRTFDRLLLKPNYLALNVACKIIASPKAVQHIFGVGHSPDCNGKHSTREYYFEDSNLDLFALYDFKSTTDFWGENDPNRKPQDHLAPKRRKLDYPTPEEFWASDEPHPFRVNCSQYADYIKFKLWFLREVNSNFQRKSLLWMGFLEIGRRL